MRQKAEVHVVDAASYSRGSPDPRLALDLAWEVRSRVAFFSFYVFGLSRATNETLPSLYKHADHGSALSLSVDAVSLAFMTQKQNGHTCLVGLARRKYVEAISELNRALRTPHLAVEDATLQSVLLLDLYEKIVSRGVPPSLGSWMAHINGAVALIEARGDGNIASQTARGLAVRLVTTMLISCHATLSAIPSGIVDLCQKLDVFLPQTHIKWQVNLQTMSLINLKADIGDGSVCSDAEILKKALLLEAEFAATEERLAPVCKPLRVAVEPGHPLVLGDYYDVDKDHVTTQGANVLRSMRMLLVGLIFERLGKTTPEEHQLWRRLDDLKERLAREVCASVPQFLLPEALPTNALPFTPLQTLQCYAILSPLYVAWYRSSDAKLRSWVAKTMAYMADAGAMAEARQVADAMEKSLELPFWTVYSIMGSYVFAAQ